MIAALLRDIHLNCDEWSIEVLLTLNISEPVTIDMGALGFPVLLIQNKVPQGFGTNHNAAFRRARGEYFCVINPDIRFDACPFSGLLAGFDDLLTGICAPVVLSPAGQLEDSARQFPSPAKIFGKLFDRARLPDYRFEAQSKSQWVDWCAGMMMVFPQRVFAELKGFDERYFLYYEDVDICARLVLSGRRVKICTTTQVVHHAQRSSHRQLRYMVWHIRSILRFFLSPVYRRLRNVSSS